MTGLLVLSLLIFSSTRYGSSEAACQLDSSTQLVEQKNMLLFFNAQGFTESTEPWTGTFSDCCNECCNSSSCQQGFYYPNSNVCQVRDYVISSLYSANQVMEFDGCKSNTTCDVNASFQVSTTSHVLASTSSDGTYREINSSWIGTLQDCCSECCSRIDCRSGLFFPTLGRCDLLGLVYEHYYYGDMPILLSNDVCAATLPVQPPPAPLTSIPPALPPPLAKPPVPSPPQQPPGDESSGSSSNTGVIAGATLGAIAFVLLCVLIAFFALRKRRSDAGPDAPPHHFAAPLKATPAASIDHTPPYQYAAPPGGPPLQPAAYGSGESVPRSPGPQLQAPPYGSGESVPRAGYHNVAVNSMASAPPFAPLLPQQVYVEPKGSNAASFNARKAPNSPLISNTSISSSLYIRSQGLLGTNSLGSSAPAVDGSPEAFLAAQLDAMHRNAELLCGRYRLGDQGSRRVGGQGMVQFAAHAWQAQKEYAIKFYLNPEAFATERAVLSNPAMQNVMPLVEEVVSNEINPICVLDRPLPPFVVIEKGESLDFWLARAQADAASAMHILQHVVECAAAMHAAGIVHRDLKPANIIFYPARNKWNIIDWGAAAPAGSMAPAACTLAYAAPETVLAFMRGETAWVADSAVDVWALGCMAWSLFTHTPVYLENTRQEVEETMLGHRRLPWERTDDPEYKVNMRKLGWMKNDILRMLARDPAQRDTLHTVLTSWRSYLQRSSIFQTTVSMPQPQVR